MHIDAARKKYLREEYESRINRVIDFIEANIDKELSLKTLAGIASFSPFHFHRVFRAMAGETLNQFIQRVRVEKAAVQLLSNPKKSITEIALDCGFSGSATFARAFRDAFDMSASQWRSGGYRKKCKVNGNSGQLHCNIGKGIDSSSYYDGDVYQNQIWRRIIMKKVVASQVEVREMPELNVAYIRHIGPYKGNSKLFEDLIGKLMAWAGPRDLLRFPETKVIIIYHDDPEITDEEKLRTSVCITVPKDTGVTGPVGKMTVNGGKYVAARFELATDEYQQAWDFVFSQWMPESGYQPDDGPCFEMYLNNPDDHPEKKCVVEICVPVKPL